MPDEYYHLDEKVMWQVGLTHQDVHYMLRTVHDYHMLHTLCDHHVLHPLNVHCVKLILPLRGSGGAEWRDTECK